jgi:hypothetical protein
MTTIVHVPNVSGACDKNNKTMKTLQATVIDDLEREAGGEGNLIWLVT